jgi:hypothetical protein
MTSARRAVSALDVVGVKLAKISAMAATQKVDDLQGAIHPLPENCLYSTQRIEAEIPHLVESGYVALPYIERRCLRAATAAASLPWLREAAFSPT